MDIAPPRENEGPTRHVKDVIWVSSQTFFFIFEYNVNAQDEWQK